MKPEAVRGGAIRLRNLTLGYDGRKALEDLSGEFAAGSLTAVVGPNGAGKTSLMASIMGRIRPRAGTIHVDLAPGEREAWLPQQAEIDRSLPVRVFDLVALGHWSRLGGFRGINESQAHCVNEALASVGLAGFERRSIGELSAGQFQRVLFARVVLQDASIILLDEPFNAVDERTTADLLALIARWYAQGRTVVAVVHDLELVRSHFPRTLLLARRCIAWGATGQVLQPSNLAQARRVAERWSEVGRPLAFAP